MAVGSAALTSFRKAGVVVFADSRTGLATLPAGAQQARREPNVGNYIPMALVTTADGSKSLGGISYNTMKADMRGAVRDLRDSLEGKDILGDGGGGAEVASSETTVDDSGDTPTLNSNGLLFRSQDWTNSEGNSIRAAIKSVDGETVQFLMPNGSLVPYPLEKLSAESRERIQARLN